MTIEEFNSFTDKAESDSEDDRMFNFDNFSSLKKN